jgi:hypothetical protein
MTIDKIEQLEAENERLRAALETAREQLNGLLMDEDLDDEKLRAASEELLPNMVDGFSAVLNARQLALQPQEGNE